MTNDKLLPYISCYAVKTGQISGKLTERRVNRTLVVPPRDHARAVISSYSVIKKLRGQVH